MKKICIFVCLLSSFLFAQNYTNKKIDLMDKNGKTKLATITKGTMIEVLEKNEKFSKVKLSGWSYEDAPNDEIFSNYGVLVKLGVLEKNAKREIIAEHEDEYEEVWIQNFITGFIPNDSITSDFKSLWKDESTFANERCGGCHGVPAFDAHFANEFPSLIDSMKEMAGIVDEEAKSMTNYYQKNNIYAK